MAAPRSLPDLETTRRGIVRKMREVRRAHGWTQAELGEHLGLSQARLSVVERGGGTISAEQFVHLLALANLPIEAFLPQQDPETEVQNALVRLGAFHLQVAPAVMPSQRVASVHEVLRETLVHPRSFRLLAALAPVLVWNADRVNLPALQRELAALGMPTRLPWLAANVRAALDGAGPPPNRKWTTAVRRSRALLDDFVARLPMEPAPRTHPDRLDPDVRSARAMAEMDERASSLSRRWNIVTATQPEDFAEALSEAYASG